ncbi:hypothetical protein DPMN_140664 [Dreissena polymorpha]|uniref:Uncharacterized protein n=1 Tax=Dreissena polymorpha TaxID=45954 RepID=A0A9D4JHL4_DREPO|nr:hypothetical protein DPMN_140664 [Dreissena polymorpha]
MSSEPGRRNDVERHGYSNQFVDTFCRTSVAVSHTFCYQGNDTLQRVRDVKSTVVEDYRGLAGRGGTASSKPENIEDRSSVRTRGPCTSHC